MGAQAGEAEEPIWPVGSWEIINHDSIISLCFGVISYTAIDNWSLPYESPPFLNPIHSQGLLSPS